MTLRESLIHFGGLMLFIAAFYGILAPYEFSWAVNMTYAFYAALSMKARTGRGKSSSDRQRLGIIALAFIGAITTVHTYGFQLIGLVAFLGAEVTILVNEYLIGAFRLNRKGIQPVPPRDAA